MRITELVPRPSAGEPLEIPAELMDSVMRHQANLTALVTNLKDAGFDDALIDVSVRALIDSYASELSIAIRAMMRVPNHV